ncbi:hypothetical protein M427DRAFT_403224 [Gonapodya prolifera JEL478]|uniref:GDP/GTP exchange factor Sec2 N-terminal domain-containing protein n=1 Tax=Gonapodya prolifera (strain JEL478) TaxID=1344416 RepID=A0A139ATX7_GONPJ|nr:hypothetical protein M427DRAFT_403224 [Gonapodya prolifera JEL478]|eukprot:KXS20149.1 hypothetical protein M427DRAFT_403224 [Gonapodya prolifera JEL478]
MDAQPEHDTSQTADSTVKNINESSQSLANPCPPANPQSPSSSTDSPPVPPAPSTPDQAPESTNPTHTNPPPEPEPCPHRRIFRDTTAALTVFPADVDIPAPQPLQEGEGGEAARCLLCREEIPALGKMFAQNRHLLTLLTQTRHHLSTHLAQCEPASASLTTRAVELERQCRDRAEELKATQRDLQIMGEKLIDEIEKRAELQHSKESVQEELEQLTTQLFEEANGLVAAEKRQRAHAERQHRHLEDELRSTRNRLELETAQLEELRRRMEDLEAANRRLREEADLERAKERGREVDERDRRERETAQGDIVRSLSAAGQAGDDAAALEGVAKDVTSGSGGTRASGDGSGVVEAAGAGASSRPSDAGYASDEDGEDNPDDWIDPMAIAAFADFLSALPSVRFPKVPSLAFMRVAIEDDVEPCLRFGGAPKVSVRRIADAFVANTLFVQETPSGAASAQGGEGGAPVRGGSTPGDATPLSSGVGSAAASPSKPVQSKSVWERLAGLPGVGPPDVCQACGATSPRGQPCRFQFRISDLDVWSALCLRCRDRMVAVGDFYNFIRHVHQGLYARRPIIETYKEQARLRRNMFYARMGALELGLQDKNFGRVKAVLKHTDERRDRGKTSTAPSSAPRSPPTLRMERGSATAAAKPPVVTTGSPAPAEVAVPSSSTSVVTGALAHSPLWQKRQLLAQSEDN